MKHLTMKLHFDSNQIDKTKGDYPMAIVKLKEPSAKTPIDLGGGGMIKRRGNTFYISRKPGSSRRKHRVANSTAQKNGS
jgi:hypothetical protein